MSRTTSEEGRKYFMVSNLRTISITLCTLILLITLTNNICQAEIKSNPGVVINEIHYDPDVKTELIEFIELYNTTAEDIDLSGWYFTDAISYEFPIGSKLPAGGYIIVVQDPAHIQAKWSTGRFIVPPNLIFGPFGGRRCRLGRWQIDDGHHVQERCPPEHDPD